MSTKTLLRLAKKQNIFRAVVPFILLGTRVKKIRKSLGLF